MAFYKFVLPEYSHDLLDKLAANPNLNQFYMAGGTALSLQLGHRESIDLDFFTQEDFEAALITHLNDITYITVQLQRNSINLIADNTKVSFISWPFPITKEFVWEGDLRMLHPIDIGLLKLLALQGRHTKKDIIDLWIIDKEVITLEELLDIFEEKFEKETFNLFSSSKELFNIKEINKEQMPKMYREVEFNECLETVQYKVTRHLKKLLGV